VAQTRESLAQLPADANKVLGLFATSHTFNDASEEKLRARGLPTYDPAAPTVAEMTEVALRVLAAKNKRFLLIVEEEGADNFGNHNNAAGTLQAMHRADQAIGVARGFLQKNPQTLLLTASDSDAGGLRMIGCPLKHGGEIPDKLPARDPNGAPLDGQAGSETAPFLAAPDRQGRRLSFAIAWASHLDVSGGVLVQ